MLAYSDTKNSRLFTLEGGGSKLTKIRLTKPLDPSWKILVLADAVICCQSHGKVLLIDVRDDCQVFTIKEGGDVISVLKTSEDEKYFALGDHGSNIEVYDVKTREMVYNLPQYSTAQPTAMAFHPQLPLLIASYSDEKIFEFDSEKGQYTQRALVLNDTWRSRRFLGDVVVNIQYETNNNKIILQTHSTISIIDPSGTQRDGLHECKEFKYILYGQSFNGQMVVVEQTPDRIANNFPAALRKKQFGT
ncbi:DgyrCDS2377 [Dimorphilus gyrociliatus]|uniref:DgyrCDS2377 n=1 Tax=Dimorphilus gyrociliatus TaxID=2664684 RepID=A0A7I8VA43_9ANNE|nr:DgyrCDS2377 [Dimorphilus gyrociliatus]